MRGWVLMSRKNKKQLVPKLRFPEFRGKGEWDIKPLSKIGEIVTGNTPSTSDKENYGGDRMFVSPADISDHRFVSQTKTTLSEKGFSKTRQIPALSILFVCIGSTIGKIAQNMYDCATNQQINAVVQYAEYINAFVYYALDLNSSKIAQLAGKQAVPIINKTLFSTVLLNIPSKEEQQKIADCLTSLDELITAEAGKLEAYKDHKKGLIQKLFPAEGKTVPEWRFPEFHDCEEWDVNILKNISPAIYDGTHQTPTYIESGIPFFSVENIVSGNKNKFISRDDHLVATSKNKPEKGDILITRIGNIGFSVVIDWDYEFSIYVTLAVIRKSNIFNSFFLNFYFQSGRYQIELYSKSLLNAVPCKINMEELRKTEALLPTKPEQKKIADCLTSLDELITAQAEKIASLKAHKKGLMQGLFPFADEVGV